MPTLRLNPTVSAFETIDRRDYPGVFLDYDRDGVLNVDDPRPLTPGDDDTVEEVRLSDEIAALIELRNDYTEVLAEVMADLRRMAGPKAKVKGRVKTPLSVINKLRRKRLRRPFKEAAAGEVYTQGLTDMAGCMAVLPAYRDVDALLKRVLAGDLGTVREHEDFYRTPNNGYRAHHFIIEREGTPVEVQVKTARLARISGLSHTLYKEGHLDGAGMERLTALADRADRADAAAIEEFDALTDDEIEARLGARQNPATAPSIGRLTRAFTDYDTIRPTLTPEQDAQARESIAAIVTGLGLCPKAPTGKRSLACADLMRSHVLSTRIEAENVVTAMPDKPRDCDDARIVAGAVQDLLSLHEELDTHGCAEGVASDLPAYNPLIEAAKESEGFLWMAALAGLTDDEKPTYGGSSATRKAWTDRLRRAASAFVRQYDEVAGRAPRRNPATAPKAPTMAEVLPVARERITEIAATYAGHVKAGRFRAAARPAVERAFAAAGALLGLTTADLGLDALPPAESSESPESAPDVVGRGEGKGEGSGGSSGPYDAPDGPSAPASDLDLRQFDPVKLTKASRKAANEAAIKLLEKPDAAITEDDRAKLRLYTGAGGLTAEDADAGHGILNEHYTAYPVVQAIWDLLGRMGYKAGNVLEPGAGIGNFAGLAPSGARMVMVEKSSVSARIARLLYPEQVTRQEDFARFGFLGFRKDAQKERAEWGGPRWISSFNLTAAVGNVPFGDYWIASRNGDPFESLGGDKVRIHDYMILKSLAMLTPGSPSAIITSVGTADKKNPAVRSEMVCWGAFVGLFRLPARTFRDNADTDVTTDLVIFQRRKDDEVIRLRAALAEAGGDLSALSPARARDLGLSDDDLAFVRVDEVDATVRGADYRIRINSWLNANKAFALGTLEAGHGQQFVSRFGVRGDFSASKLLSVGRGLRFPFPLPAGASGRGTPPSLYVEGEGVALPSRTDDPSGAVVWHDGEDGPKAGFYEKNARLYSPFAVPKTHRARVRSALALLDQYAAYVEALGQQAAKRADGLRSVLLDQITAHVERYGLFQEDDALNKVLRLDSRLFKLRNLLREDEDGALAFDGVSGRYRYADVLTATTLYNDAYTPTLADNRDLSEIVSYVRSSGEDVTTASVQTYYAGGTATRDEVWAAMADHPDFYENPAYVSWKISEAAGFPIGGPTPEPERYEHAYDYLSGDLWPKIDTAETVMADEPSLSRNVEALRAALPEQASVYEIGLNPAQAWSWLGAKPIADWLRTAIGANRVEVNLYGGFGAGRTAEVTAWAGTKATGRTPATKADETMGWGGMPYRKIVEVLVSGGSFPSYVPNEKGLPSGIALKDASDEQKAAARSVQVANHDRMLREIPAAFTEWVRTTASDETRAAIEDRFNRRYNSVATPAFDGRTFRVRGMSNTFYGIRDFTVYRHNLRAAEMALTEGRFGNCHDVGAGKTLATIIATMAGKQRGLWRKPMFVVPGKVIEKWAREITDLFPDAKVLNLRLSGRSTDREIALAQMYDWDVILVPTHAFSRMEMSPAVEGEMIEERLRDFRAMVEDYVLESKASGGAGIAKREKKRIERMMAKLEARLKKIRDRETRGGDRVYFDQLGVDMLAYDEAHFFKNALASPKAQALGIAANKPSQRAEDALMKADVVRRLRGDNRGVMVLTATPVVNSPIEVFHMIRLVAPDLLAHYGISNLDDFIEVFVRTGMREVRRMTGKYVSKLVVTGYDNLPELRRLIGEVMDVKSYEQLRQFYLDFPEIGPNGKPVQPFKRPDAVREMDTAEPSRLHDLYFEDLRHRAEAIMECYRDPDCEPREMKDNFLVLTRDGSAISTDLRLYRQRFLDFSGPFAKASRMAQAVAERYKAAAPARRNPAEPWDALDGVGGYGESVRRNPSKAAPVNQLVFCDFVRLPDGRSFHKVLKDLLVERGIPAEQVCIINGKTIGVKNGRDYAVKGSDDKEELKAEAQDEFNDGRYRVIIGNKTIAEGMNLQRHTTAIHHLDVPYTPGEITQRDGRGVRQGNVYSEVEVRHYLMARSFDEHRLRLVNKKANWIEQLFYGDERSMDADDSSGELTYEEMMAAVADDPRIAEFFTLQGRIRRGIPTLQSLRAQQQKLTRTAAEQEASIVRAEDWLDKTRERDEKVAQAEVPATAADALASGKVGYGHKWQRQQGRAPSLTPLPALKPRLYGSEVKMYGLIAQLDVTEPREFFALHLQVGVQANASDETVRYVGRLVRTEDPADRRRFYGVHASSSQSAMRVLTNAEWWDLGTGEDFEATYGVSLAEAQAETVTVWDADKGKNVEGKRSWLQAKDALGMRNPAKFWPVIRERLTDALLTLERRWRDRATARIESAERDVEIKKQRYATSEAALKQRTEALRTAEAEIERAEKRVAELRPIIAQINTTEHANRDVLREAIEREIRRMVDAGYIEVRDTQIASATSDEDADVDLYDEDDDDSGDAYLNARSNPACCTRMERATAGGTERENPAVPVAPAVALLGQAVALVVDGPDGRVMYEPDPGETVHLLAHGAPGEPGRLLLVSARRETPQPTRPDSDTARQMREAFEHAPASGGGFTLAAPAGALSPLTDDTFIGTGIQIRYDSTKRIEPGDAGEVNRYVHDHDLGRRRAHLLDGDVLAIEDVTTDGAGILD